MVPTVGNLRNKMSKRDESGKNKEKEEYRGAGLHEEEPKKDEET